MRCKILRMPTYAYSEGSIHKAVCRFMRIRLWLCGASVAPLAVYLTAMFVRTDAWVTLAYLSSPWAEALFIVPFVLLVQAGSGWKREPIRLQKHMHAYKVTLSPDCVSVENGVYPHLQLEREEIRCAEEPSFGGGLYLRTKSRYKWLLIPLKLDGYSDLKEALGSSGVPIVRTIIPPNWEEFVLALVYCGSIVCDVAAHDRTILALNCVIVILAAILCVLILNSSSFKVRRRSWARVAVFIPAVLAVLSLFLELDL